MIRTFRLKVVNIVRRVAAHLDRTLERAEPEPPMLEPEEAARQAREQHRRAFRASRTPWYYRRTRRFEVPEQLKYYEAVHGTKATLKMLTARAKREKYE